jgi:hypothetical protein
MENYHIFSIDLNVLTLISYKNISKNLIYLQRQYFIHRFRSLCKRKKLILHIINNSNV